MPGLIRAGFGWIFGVNTLQLQSFDTTGHTHILYCVRVNRNTHILLLLPLPAVVAEFDDVVLVAVPLGVHYKTKESLLLLLPIDLHPPPEEPVTTVLAGTPEYSGNIRE